MDLNGKSTELQNYTYAVKDIYINLLTLIDQICLHSCRPSLNVTNNSSNFM